MRKLVLASLLVFAVSSSALAGYKSAGCGLGSMVIKDDGLVQIFATTTNGTFGSQTFGITSGTSNCVGSGGYANADAEKEMYVSSNFESISQEMAQGRGEHLDALASIMGCQDNAKFGAVMKANYRTLASQKPDTMLGAVKSKIQTDPTLNKVCKG